jgi:hypothetical protein
VLSRTNIEEIIKFAHKEELFVFADEVRKNQTTICGLNTLRTSDISVCPDAY